MPRPKATPRISVAIPKDFPNYFGDRDVAMIDSVVVQLLQARADLSQPSHAARARALVHRVWQTIVPFGDAANSQEARHEMLVAVLAAAGRIKDPANKTAFAQVVIGEALPRHKVPADVLQRAVLLWPQTKRREARSRAMHELARALECDRPSLMTMLRQARARLRQLQADAWRK